VAHLQNRTSPTLKPSFAKEPPSQLTKNRHEIIRTKTTEKKCEVPKAVFRNGGCSGKLKISFSNQLLWWLYILVLLNLPFLKAENHWQ
jgi:hypothetical protein